MKNNDIKRLQVEQLDKKLSQFSPLKTSPIPSAGWINAIRTALNMSLRQLAKQLQISVNSAKAIEQRETNGTITIQTLKRAANALEMDVVYALVPRGSTLEEMIEKKARALAKTIVERTSTSMTLEDQGNSVQRLEKAIEEKTDELKRERPRMLWD